MGYMRETQDSIGESHDLWTDMLSQKSARADGEASTSSTTSRRNSAAGVRHRVSAASVRWDVVAWLSDPCHRRAR
jgi:hypothetical protein